MKKQKLYKSIAQCKAFSSMGSSLKLMLSTEGAADIYQDSSLWNGILPQTMLFYDL